jgi:hypothetical protein
MANNVIVVPELVVRVVTGDTCYRYEDGFSAIYAEVTTDDSTLAEQLRHVEENSSVVTLRCAMRDVTAPLINIEMTLASKRLSCRSRI